MPRPRAADDLAKIGEKIRRDRDPFIEAATQGFRKLIEMEYARLRSYAFEGNSSSISMDITMRCDFTAKPAVIISSRPRFRPSLITESVQLEFDAR